MEKYKMGHWKMRLLGVVIIAVFAGLLYYDWYMLLEERRYYMKLAVLAPLGIIGGFFVLLFPSKAGKPETGTDKLITFLVFLVGMAAGFVNLYLMDPGFFSF
jgi:heme/copper-type cytochrome/quinol oxidase subunit 1